MSPSHSGGSPPFWLPNPFTDGAVGSVWEPESADVPGIHADVFAGLLEMVARRRSGLRDRCALLYGNAGSGKTHLIRRLRLALQDMNRPPSVFSWIRMQTSPAMMWRHLRRTFAHDLLMADLSGRRQIQHLLAKPADQIEAVTTRDLSIVLEHLAAKRHQREARTWLMGDRLPESALQTLQIGPGDLEEESLEDESRRVVRDVAALLRPVPLVLCLDQLEAMQSHPGDKTGLFAIGSLVATLHDEMPDAVGIGCVQTSLIDELERTLSGHARDRYRTLRLQPLTADQTRDLVLARLNTYPDIARARPSGASEYWPIDVVRLERFAASPEGLTARKAIFECDRMFRAIQGMPAAPQPEADFLQEQYEARLQASQRELTSDTSAAVLSDGLARLLHMLGVKVRRDDIPRWMDHIVEPAAASAVGVVIANDSPQSFWRKLDRIKREWNPKEHRLVVLRDSLNPLGPSAKGSRDRLAELEKRGATVLSPSREALAALDAMRRLLADAESGDLALGGDSVAPATVEDWVRQKLPEALSRLADGICGKTTEIAAEANELLRDVLALIAEQKVAAVPELARLLNRTTQEIEGCVRENEESFGLAEGAERVVFEKVPVESGA